MFGLERVKTVISVVQCSAQANVYNSVVLQTCVKLSTCRAVFPAVLFQQLLAQVP